ncbi:MAG: hypothetical protein KIT17_09340 [Rubrivivax sp.]|nr:hypothetical protein [Burkholderiales bacterium]MCW5633528.1 hypothetical protein [Rubrivivax sp.]
MPQSAADTLRDLAEPLAAISLRHLSPETRQKLKDDELSVNAYPTGVGGLVFVGIPRQAVPREQDLAVLFDSAEQAGIAWLLFDDEAEVVDGLPLFAPTERDVSDDG